jgi:hypothetical protein
MEFAIATGRDTEQMNSGYEAGTWTAMYGAVAAAAAAFAGLLFVALTVNLARVLPDAAHVARAREALAGLLSLLVMALLVLIPGQARGALGIELLGLAAVLVAFSIGFQVQTMRLLPPRRRARWAVRMLPVTPSSQAPGAACTGWRRPWWSMCCDQPWMPGSC